MPRGRAVCTTWQGCLCHVAGLSVPRGRAVCDTLPVFLQSILQTQQDEGNTVIITTHSMEEADALCDRIGIMCGGQLRCLGSDLYLKS